MNKARAKKPRGKLFYGLCIFGVLFLIGIISNVFQKQNPEKPVQSTAKTPKPVENKKMVFPKHLIDLNEVKKHPQLHTETEHQAYWYRYNQSASAAYHKKPEMARENYQKFMRYKQVLGEKRFNEIMNLADSDYPFK